MTSTAQNHLDSSSSSSNNLPPSTNTFTIEFLCKLIPQGFSGDRYDLGPFLANCNNANDLANNDQKTALLYYILSKITGRAKEQLAQQSFKDWKDLKEKLKTLYQDKKHYCQIMEDLNNCKQISNESVSDFFQRLELLNSRALSATQQYTSDKSLLPGKLQSINEITLNRFIYHSNPRISQMLRWKDFTTLNQAYTAAVAEERALNIYKQFCKICRKNNHDTQRCRFNKQSSNSNNSQSNQNSNSGKSKNLINFAKNNDNDNSNRNSNNNSNYKNSNNNGKFCKYCKKQNHTINECRKLQYKKQKELGNESKNESINLNSNQSSVADTSLENSIAQLTVFEN